MITLETNAGLANRMRAVASAVSLAKEFNTKLVVIWPKNKWLNCDFISLFEPIKEVPTSLICNHSILWRFSSKIAKYKYDNVFLNITVHNNQDLLLKLKAGEDVYINTCSQFYDVNEFRCFCAKQCIQEKVDTIIEDYKDCLVGIHIRRTDNKKSIEMSPTRLFIDEIDKEITKNTGVKFYLATDSKEDERELLSKYGDRILINKNKELSRNSKAGIIDALVDLLCLSYSSKLLGSYWSSFSEVAALMNGKKELNVLTK